MKKNKNFNIWAMVTLLALPASIMAQQLPFQNPYAFGLDVSFVKQREDNGEKYMDTDSIVKPSLQIFKEHGYNWGRIMICNEPTSSRLPQNLQYVVSAGQDLKKYGYRFLLDYMFSNGWANPMGQPTPSAWKGLTHENRVKAVYQYIKESMTALKEAGAMPDMVQVGNEIGNGFLWPDGRIRYDSTQLSKWENFTDYLSAGTKAIREVSGKENKIKIMLHVDHGGDIPMTKTFFDKMREYKVDYDVMGFSFYPWSHGTLLDLKDNMRFAANEYGKEIIVVETGYYWRASNYFKNTTPPCKETPEGQQQWLESVNEIVLGIPNGLGRGIFWWEPMMRGRGYFDDNRKVQPIIHALDKYSLPVKRADGQTRIQ
ncbi:MAG TPA: glycosyl hydrolase 53 family protein [Bacteroidales bacterium]